MRKLINGPLCQLGQIADSALFTGFLEDESGYFSDASLYDDDDDDFVSEDELFEVKPKQDTEGGGLINKTKPVFSDGCEDNVFDKSSQAALVSDMLPEDDSDLILGTTVLRRITRSKLAKHLKRKEKNEKGKSEGGSAANKSMGKGSSARGALNASGSPELQDAHVDEKSQKSKRGRLSKAKVPENEAVNSSSTVVKVKQALNHLSRDVSINTHFDEGLQSSSHLAPEKLLGTKKIRKKCSGINDVRGTIVESEDVGSATSHDSGPENTAQGRVETAVQVAVCAKPIEKGRFKVKGTPSIENSGEGARGSRPRKGQLVELPEMKEVGGRDLARGIDGAKVFQRRKSSSKGMGFRVTEGITQQQVLKRLHKERGEEMVNAINERKGKQLETGNVKLPIKMKENNVFNSSGIQRKNSGKVEPAVADNERIGIKPSIKDSRKGDVKGSKAQNLIKGNDGLSGRRNPAEIVSDGGSKAVALRASSGMEHPGFDVKDRKPKAACTEITRHEHGIAHSSSIRKSVILKGREQQVATKITQGDGRAVKEACASLESVHGAVEWQRTVAEKEGDNLVAGDEVSSGVTEGGEGNKLLRTSEKADVSSGGEGGTPAVGWVLCDECQKWRCIPAELADVIEATGRTWSCRDNQDKRFADCSIPQEKSNAEINADLNISEVSFYKEGDKEDPPVDSKLGNECQNQDRERAVWTLIKSNIFQHRRRKVQTIDEIMVCHCVPPENGGVGCGDECLNRMLSIECIPQTCPCGDLCSNQQFQRRSYANVGSFRCGKKGFGLKVLNDVPKGTFIIEYVGEVLDMAAYEARQKEYAFRGQKHFYFMTLNSTEVIDACIKGNLGRFINHSCEPNCTTEKWLINGEVCIGLFAIRDLMKDEEITFDYNYVRVCGAAAKKCQCGSTECRGFIGGDPMTPVTIVESDSDEDDLEPMMIEEGSEEEDDQNESSKSLIGKTQQGKDEPCPMRVPGVKRKWATSETGEKQGISSKRVMTSLTLRKLGSTNPKRLTIETSGGRFEGVEERLNEMLDENGGLCKRREASTHYLKLLIVTAASGDTVKGEASRSTRDLSMVLDALLKTVSRIVLMDIVRKNGLQILHNMIKRFRRNYKKTPIIRKLMKVLEFLATEQVLTIDQINSQPPHYGIESVRDTIFELCRHGDTEVQQIARRFREKWVPRKFSRKLLTGQEGFPLTSAEQSNKRSFSKHHEHHASAREVDPSYERSMPSPDDELARKHKKPSRWDQPSQEVLDTTLAGGLPQSFWPFNASNLLPGKSHQNLTDHAPRHIETASCDEFGARHPVPPVFPAFDQQHSAASTGTHLPAPVNGIPVGQFMAASSTAIIPQQASICVGIPVALGHQFNGAHSAVPDYPCFPSMLASSHCMNHTEGRQALVLSSTRTEVHEKKPLGNMTSLSDETSKGSKIIFGVSPSQFFQQMHSLFGSVFHPWQLQVLMAPHAWGSYLYGDASKGSGPISYPPGFSGAGGSVNMTEAGSDRVWGQGSEPELEPEPPVPGLSPPRFPPRSTEANGWQYIGDENYEKGSSMSRPSRANVTRWSKSYGRGRHRNFGHRRDFGYPHRQNRQNFAWREHVSSTHPPGYWEDVSYRQNPSRTGIHSSAPPVDPEEIMSREAEEKMFPIHQDASWEDLENPSTCMQLEKPWGFGQENYFKEEMDNNLDTTEQFSHDTFVKDEKNTRKEC